jgi:hypothetical protein
MERQIKETVKYLYDNVKAVNDSKIFAGLVILTLNISNKFITLPMSRTVESMFKHTLSQYVLVFAISWMGTRDVFMATIVTGLFALLMEVFLNENSRFCCLSEGFTTSHVNKLQEEEGLTKEELDDAIRTIQKAQDLLRDSQSLGK